MCKLCCKTGFLTQHHRPQPATWSSGALSKPESRAVSQCTLASRTVKRSTRADEGKLKFLRWQDEGCFACSEDRCMQTGFVYEERPTFACAAASTDACAGSPSSTDEFECAPASCCACSCPVRDTLDHGSCRDRVLSHIVRPKGVVIDLGTCCSCTHAVGTAQRPRCMPRATSSVSFIPSGSMRPGCGKEPTGGEWNAGVSRATRLG